MKQLSPRSLTLIALVAVAILVIGVFAFQSRPLQEPDSAVEVPENGESQEGQKNNDQEFVTDVDMNIDNWQTKETEFFTIKFPKEWYWMESNREKTGYRSYVITNNPDFDIDRYADIGVFTGGRYLFTSESEGVESKPLSLKDGEIVVSTNGLGWSTSNAGTPYAFMENVIQTIKKGKQHAECHYDSGFTTIPLTAYCLFIDDKSDQKVQTYYVSNKKRTFAYTSRTVEEGDFDSDDVEIVLKKIATSLIQKDDF